MATPLHESREADNLDDLDRYLQLFRARIDKLVDHCRNERKFVCSQKHSHYHLWNGADRALRTSDCHECRHAGEPRTAVMKELNENKDCGLFKCECGTFWITPEVTLKKRGQCNECGSSVAPLVITSPNVAEHKWLKLMRLVEELADFAQEQGHGHAERTRIQIEILARHQVKYTCHTPTCTNECYFVDHSVETQRCGWCRRPDALHRVSPEINMDSAIFACPRCDWRFIHKNCTMQSMFDCPNYNCTNAQITPRAVVSFKTAGMWMTASINAAAEQLDIARRDEEIAIASERERRSLLVKQRKAELELAQRFFASYTRYADKTEPPRRSEFSAGRPGTIVR